MSVVVSRHQPTIPAWAWMSIALASLLVIMIGGWIAEQFPPVGSISSKPTVQEAVPETAALGVPIQGNREQAEQSKIMDWSEPKEHFQMRVEQPAPEPKEPERIAVVVGETPSQSKTKVNANQTIVKQESKEEQRIVLPPVRLRPEPETPGRFAYGNNEWVLSDAPAVTTNEVSLSATGETVDGREVYTLLGEPEPSLIFMETSPGSGQYKLYRPVG